VRPGTKDAAGHRPRTAADDYRAKVSREASLIARSIKEAGHPAPLGDPTSGVVLVVEQPVGPRVLDALSRSLDAVGLADAYVTYGGAGQLMRELLSAEPSALVAVGPGAAREIDALDYPLAQRPYTEAREGAWFAWTKGTAGLRLPALGPALDDEEAKRNFWRAFLALRDLATAPQP
jgi:hypothetical protein